MKFLSEPSNIRELKVLVSEDGANNLQSRDECLQHSRSVAPRNHHRAVYRQVEEIPKNIRVCYNVLRMSGSDSRECLSHLRGYPVAVLRFALFAPFQLEQAATGQGEKGKFALGCSFDEPRISHQTKNPAEIGISQM
ncbi:hypothetical protein [Bradyrhizobium sp. 144]|uniref:hypothetical protein n=1 Tax=Bradyrhizobium sp. 144 TaxID=2782620 RepID=UPI001FFA1C96|nr:hypothetical protein [Bradyrhizobium sp. 144]MCK1698785.1 hypothetical protein [Bradyrhizobium sp. 144]